MNTKPIGASESFVPLLSSPAAATSPAKIPTTSNDPRNENTGNQASALSDRNTAHERLAISHEVWMRFMPPVSTIQAARCSHDRRRPRLPVRHRSFSVRRRWRVRAGQRQGGQEQVAVVRERVPAYVRQTIDRTASGTLFYGTPIATTRQDCANNGWRTLTDANGNPFRNIGQCIAVVSMRTP